MINRRREEPFPIPFKIRKFGIEWYRIGTCCDIDYYIPKILMVLFFVFKNRYYWHCDQCGKTHCIELVYHTVPYYDKKIRENNRMLDNYKDKWR